MFDLTQEALELEALVVVRRLVGIHTVTLIKP